MELRKNYYLLSRVCAALANSFFMFTIIWLLQEQTNNSLIVGSMNALFSVTASLSILYGPLIDRHSPKAVSLIALFLQVSLFLGLTVMIGLNSSYFIIMVVSVFASTCDEFFNPADRMILKNQVSEEAQLNQLNSKISLIDQSANFVGVAVAGIGLGLVQVFGMMMISTVLCSMGLLLLIQALKRVALPLEHSKEERQPYGRMILEGYRYLRQNPFLNSYLFSSLMYSFVTPFFILLLPYLANKMGSATYYSGLYAAFFIGFVVGAIGCNYVQPRFQVIRFVWIASGIPLVLLFFFNSYLVYLLVIFLFGFLSSIQNILASTLIQIQASEAYLGRVLTTYKTVFSVGGPIGSILAGIFLKNNQVLVLIAVAIVLIVVSGLLLKSEPKG